MSACCPCVRASSILIFSYFSGKFPPPPFLAILPLMRTFLKIFSLALLSIKILFCSYYAPLISTTNILPTVMTTKGSLICFPCAVATLYTLQMADTAGHQAVKRLHKIGKWEFKVQKIRTKIGILSKKYKK